jgi:hypothetical protein
MLQPGIGAAFHTPGHTVAAAVTVVA